MNRLLAFVFGLIFIILVAEFGLRSASFINGRSKAAVVDLQWRSAANLIRLVTIGESTTAPIDGTEWPAQFESILNSKLQARGESLRVRVVNIARSAGSSPFQLAALQEIASELKPDIVVSMLGVNDSAIEAVEPSFIYRNSFLVRLLFWSRVAWLCPSCYEMRLSIPINNAQAFSDIESEAQTAGWKIYNAISITSSEAVAQLEAEIRTLRKKYGTNLEPTHDNMARALAQISRSLKVRKVRPEFEKDLWIASERFFLESYEYMIKRNHSSVEVYCFVLLDLGKVPECSKTIKLALANGAPVTPSLLTLAAWVAAENDPDMQAIFLQTGFRLDRGKNLSGRVVRNVYRRIGDLVNEMDAVWFAMQYPKGSIEGLKFFLSDAPEDNRTFHSLFYTKEKFQPVDRYRGVFFVSNENFGTIVDSTNEEEYFTDYFGRTHGLDFGHTTPKGHELIAQNLVAALLENWTAVKEAVERRRKSGH